MDVPKWQVPLEVFACFEKSQLQLAAAFHGLVMEQPLADKQIGC